MVDVGSVFLNDPSEFDQANIERVPFFFGRGA